MAGTFYTVNSNSFLVKDGNSFIKEISKYPFYNDFEIVMDKDNPNKIAIFHWGTVFKGIIPYNPTAESYYGDTSKYKSKNQNIEAFSTFISKHLCRGEVFRIVSCVSRIALFCETEELVVYDSDFEYNIMNIHADEPKSQSISRFKTVKAEQEIIEFNNLEFLNRT